MEYIFKSLDDGFIKYKNKIIETIYKLGNV